MQFGCTKKLRDYIGRGGSTPDSSADSFYCWSATLMTVNRRKVIVAIHDDSHCGFVIYGVTQKTLKNLENILLQGIRQMLECAHIAPQIIEDYFRNGKEEIEFTPARNRSVVAKLNVYGDRFQWLSLFIKPGDLYQTHMLSLMNRYLVKRGDQHLYLYDILYSSFQQHFPGQEILCIPTVTLDVALLDTPCIRRIQLPLHSTLDQLHQTVQNVFIWNDEHLHSFLSEDQKRLDQICPDYAFLAEKDEWDQLDSDVMEKFITLGDIFRERKSILYIYDYGDDWRHKITLVNVETKTAFTPPRCLLATGMAPPEDCGGTSGYQEMRRILQDPSDEEYEEMKEWAEGIRWQEVNIENINRRLKQVIISH